MSQILILAEIENEALHSTTAELLAAARKLADELGLEVAAALLGNISNELSKEAIALGADHVYSSSHPMLTSNVADAHVAAVSYTHLTLPTNREV
mgnify:CR=1 FL=1